MRKLLRTLLRILDGSPGALGRQRQRGQSLIELAFITPLLAIMVVGIVEIGWYANHILILLEVTRVGARAGTVLTGELAPLQWIEDASIHPVAYVLDTGYVFSVPPLSANYSGTTVISNYAVKGVLEPGDASPPYDVVNNPVPVPKNAELYRQCGTDKVGFYNFIACTMLNSMEPIVLRGRAPTDQVPVAKKVVTGRTVALEDYLYPDDIVVSVFSLQSINNDSPADWKTNPTVYTRTIDFANIGNTYTATYPPGFYVRVVGRYPRTANECNVIYTPTAPATSPNYLPPNTSAITRILEPLAQYGEYEASGQIQGEIAEALPAGNFSIVDQAFNLDMRDPFDYIPDTVRNTLNGRPIELEGMDTNPEFQRGFIWTGQHVVKEYYPDGSQLFCLGSEWTNSEIEKLLNTEGFLKQAFTNGSATWPTNNTQVDTDTAWRVANGTPYKTWLEQAEYLPNQGLVLVEMFWNHDTLLSFPFLTTMVQIFGDTQRIELSIWAAFPVPSAEPNIVFRLPDE